MTSSVWSRSCYRNSVPCEGVTRKTPHVRVAQGSPREPLSVLRRCRRRTSRDPGGLHRCIEHGDLPDARASRQPQTGRRRRCFAVDETRMVMPAFGEFTGGLNIRDAAFADLFGTLAYTAHMLGPDRLYAFTAKRCLGD